MRNESGRNGRASLADPGDWMLLGKRLGMVALALGTLGLAAGCTGAVGPNAPTKTGGSTPNGSGNSGSGAPTGGGTTGGGSPATTGSGAGTAGTPGGMSTATPGMAPGNAPTTPPLGAKTAGFWDNLPASTGVDAGRVVLRRLNNAEYDNTARDLIGTMSKPSLTYMFPDDDVNELFDTNGQTLVYSDFLFAQAQSAAQGLAAEFLARPATDPIRTRILTCAPTLANFSACLTTILTPFMTNAYRRPVTAAEVTQVVTVANTIATAHADPQPGLSAALQAVLLSPNFLFRLELSGNPASPTPTKLNDYELATRLSYFLGSTMPDPQLMAAAAAGKLATAGADYSTQIDRLVTDTVRAQALVTNFAGRWLSIRDTALVAPDSAIFPSFDDSLRLSTPQETTLFFASLISDKQPLSALLTANYTFVNARLATHYGLPAPAGAAGTYSKVSLAGNTQRMGFLTQETFLTVTSLPIRTSPVKRGVWVLENLLCDGTAAPPAGVAELPAQGTGTVRQVLQIHRAQPYCSSCHSLIDPLGVAFENYDGIGAYRTKDNGVAIDASVTLPDGTAIASPFDLANVVAKDPRLTWCLTKQAMTYGVGRTFDTPEARAYLKNVAAPLAGAQGTWPGLLKAVATSDAFLTSRGEGP